MRKINNDNFFGEGYWGAVPVSFLSSKGHGLPPISGK